MSKQALEIVDKNATKKITASSQKEPTENLIESLPEELLVEIFKHVAKNLRFVPSVLGTSKMFKRIMESNSIWWPFNNPYKNSSSRLPRTVAVPTISPARAYLPSLPSATLEALPNEKAKEKISEQEVTNPSIQERESYQQEVASSDEPGEFVKFREFRKKINAIKRKCVRFNKKEKDILLAIIYGDLDFLRTQALSEEKLVKKDISYAKKNGLWGRYSYVDLANKFKQQAVLDFFAEEVVTKEKLIDNLKFSDKMKWESPAIRKYEMLACQLNQTALITNYFNEQEDFAQNYDWRKKNNISDEQFRQHFALSNLKHCVCNRDLELFSSLIKCLESYQPSKVEIKDHLIITIKYIVKNNNLYLFKVMLETLKSDRLIQYGFKAALKKENKVMWNYLFTRYSDKLKFPEHKAGFFCIDIKKILIFAVKNNDKHLLKMIMEKKFKYLSGFSYNHTFSSTEGSQQHERDNLLTLAIRLKNWDIVNYILEQVLIDIKTVVPYILNDRISSYGYTALHQIAASGNVEVMKKALAKANFNSVQALNNFSVEYSSLDNVKSGGNILYSAVCAGQLEMTKYLVEEQGMNIHQRMPDTKNTMLHAAIFSGNFWLIKYILAKSVDFNAKNQKGHTARHMAQLYKDSSHLQSSQKNKNILESNRNKYNDIINLILGFKKGSYIFNKFKRTPDLTLNQKIVSMLEFYCGKQSCHIAVSQHQVFSSGGYFFAHRIENVKKLIPIIHDLKNLEALRELETKKKKSDKKTLVSAREILAEINKIELKPKEKSTFNSLMSQIKVELTELSLKEEKAVNIAAATKLS